MKSTLEQDQEEPRSTLYIVASAALAAAILALTIFLLVRGFQWRAALADLRAEPGIEILSVERFGFFKKRLLGLKDPLAPSPETILRKHNIGPSSVEVVLTDYHSLNTPYALQRKENDEVSAEKLKESLINAVAEYSEEMQAQRKEDLEKVTRMLLEAKFPEEMKSVEVEWIDGTWIIEGELYEPTHSAFAEAVPANIIEGEVDFSKLTNLTEERTSSLGEQIVSTNLLTTDIDGEFTHIDQVVRLLADYDEVCKVSKIPLPRLQLQFISPDQREDDLRIASVWKELTVDGKIDPGRFEETLLIIPEEDPPVTNPDEDVLAYLKLLSAEE